MKLRYDPEVDAAYLTLDKAPVVESEEVRSGSSLTSTPAAGWSVSKFSTFAALCQRRI